MPYAKPNNIVDKFPTRFQVPNKKYSRYYNEAKLFTSEECDIIRKYFTNESFRKFPITTKELTINPDGSSMTEDKFVWNEETNFIYKRLVEWTKQLQLDFEWIEKPFGMYRRYREGDYFVRHDDTPWDHDGLPKRIFTIGIQLKDDYEGGEFIMDDTYCANKEKGHTCIWGIEVPHEVKLITKGIRESLTFFVDVKTGKVEPSKVQLI